MLFASSEKNDANLT